MKWIEENPTATDIWTRKYGGDFKTVILFMVKEIFSVLPLDKKSELETRLGFNPEERMIELFLDARGLPGGRILYFFASLAQGENRQLTPMNCFVIPIEDDSVEAIMDYAKHMALTFKAGGGVGTNLSGLRPEGSAVNNAAMFSTGPQSFIKIYGVVGEEIGQKNRRGAQMKAISIYHPDSLAIIQSKIDGSLTSMNISIMVNDEFMQKGMEDLVDFWYPDKIKTTPSEYKEVDYIANCYNHPDEFFKVKSETGFRQRTVYRTSTKRRVWNAIANCAWKCGDPGLLFWDTIRRDWKQEEELYSTNPCGEEPLPAWGACNLGSLNFSKYTDDNLEEFEKDTKAFFIFLDTLISYCIENSAYPLAQQRESTRKFRQIGLGITGLADLFILKGAKYGDDKSKEILEARMRAKREAEIETSEMLNEIFEGNSGPRNSQMSTVAPTGSTSMVLGCSGGIEPNFSYSYQKLVNGEYVDIYIPIVKTAPSSSVLVSSHDVPWRDRIEIQAIAQRYTDGSISSTINLPNSAKVEEISEIYNTAWKAGLKGVTIYRDGSKGDGALKLTKPHKERGILEGKTVKVPLDSSWYITVNFAEKLPVEVFINAGKSGSDTKAWTEALGRISSLFLQSGGQAGKLISALQDIKGNKTIFKNGWSIQSGPDAIAQALSAILDQSQTLTCPECGEATFLMVEGCGVCKSCGFEKC